MVTNSYHNFIYNQQSLLERKAYKPTTNNTAEDKEEVVESSNLPQAINWGSGLVVEIHTGSKVLLL